MSIIPVFIPHAGCPHQCVFCNQKTISGQKTAALEGANEQINKWLAYLNPNIKHEVAFYGGSFTGLDFQLQEQLLALSDNLFAKGIIDSVRLSTRPDYIDEERLELLRQHHVRTIELGVQSLDDKVLARAERGHNAACVHQAAALIKDFGFQLGLQLMVGMPEQDFESLKDTVEQALAIKPDIARIYPLLVIKNTPLAESYNSGEFVPLSLESAIEQAAYVYRKLTNANITVIRIGLQADEELCEPGNIVAGPFHPSMGELVKARVLRDEIANEICKFVEQGAQKLVLKFNPCMESKLRGQKNCNTSYLQKMFKGIYLEFRKDSSIEGVCIENEK